MLSDTVLWNQFIHGDDDAYIALYHTHIQSMFNYGMNFINDKECVKDCIHDVFTHLYKNKKSVSETNNVKLYLFVALKNRIIDLVRKGRQMEFMDIDVAKAAYLDVHEGEAYDAEVKRREISLLLEQLSPRQKEAVYYFYIEELSYSEIADLMNMEYQSAQNLVQRALVKLRTISKEIISPEFSV
jgi:RNA polymerase sigma factor (sigma-70 family)